VSAFSGVTFTRIPPRRSTSRAATWWGRAWVRAVEEASYSDNDLHASRVLSRGGGIGQITVDAGLLVGELPHRLVEQAEEVGVELLPYGGELGSACPCQSWVDPCRHALAVLLQVAWLIDGDPWVLLRLRGLSPEALEADLAALAAPRVDGPEAVRPADEPEGDLAIAVDAAVRAARLLALLHDPAAEIDHLV
jgi:uncharacterized Zn finger protein